MNALQAPDAQTMDELGRCLGRSLRAGAMVYLQGELGAGKTTLVRGVLKGLGYQGPVRSPTYTLVEGYELAGRMLYHLDLYRIRGLAELEYLGIRDLDDPALWVFVEWPERGTGRLPVPDISLHLETRGSGRAIEIDATSERGQSLAAAWIAEVGRTHMTERAAKE